MMTADSLPKRALRGFLCGVALLALATACTEAADDALDPQTEAPASSPPAAARTAVPAAERQASSRADIDDLARVVEQARPATVQITNQQFEFGRTQAYEVPAGVGTGVIYSNEGYVLTNYHVIEGAQALRVSLPDGAAYRARIVGTDPRTDLAVLQIEGKDLPVARLGDSSRLVLGDWVVAIGNALGLPGGPTVTAGVISALDRTAQEPGNGRGGAFLYGLLQTDAAINPGNSGGPLVNMAGEVIGINTMIAAMIAPGLQAQGIGFAININNAKAIADELVKNGSVKHAFLGINYVPLTPAVADRLGIGEKQGVVVMEVVAGSPAAQAGLQARDVITRIADKEIKGESDLAKLVDTYKPGDRVSLTVVQGSDRREFSVTLGTAPPL
jgi:S1-C subfamily serine protease